MLRIAANLPVKIHAHALRTAPYECCGGLLGTDAPGERRIARIHPLPDTEVAPDRYLIPMAAMMKMEREAADAGLLILGYYHSHPRGPAEPSRVDLDQGWPWFTYLIMDPRYGGELRAWRMREDRSGFDEEPYVVEPPAG